MGPRANVALAVGVLGFAAVGWLAADALPRGLRVDPLGPGYYPHFVFLCLGVLGVALLIASIRELIAYRQHGSQIRTPHAAERSSDAIAAFVDQDVPPISYRRMGLVLALTLGYVLALTPIGYVVSTAAYVVVLLLVLGVRSPLAVAGCAVGCPLVLNAVFGRILGVPLPGGLLDYLVGILPG